MIYSMQCLAKVRLFQCSAFCSLLLFASFPSEPPSLLFCIAKLVDFWWLSGGDINKIFIDSNLEYKLMQNLNQTIYGQVNIVLCTKTARTSMIIQCVILKWEALLPLLGGLRVYLFSLSLLRWMQWNFALDILTESLDKNKLPEIWCSFEIQHSII